MLSFILIQNDESLLIICLYVISDQTVIHVWYPIHVVFDENFSPWS